MTRLWGAIQAAWAFWALIAWTIFLWLSRLRNVLVNDELTSGGRAIRIGVVVLFVVLAGAAVYGYRRAQPVLVWVLAVWTVGYWLVRGIGILVGDYSVGFKMVHTVLMVVSLTLAGLAARQMGDRTPRPSR